MNGLHLLIGRELVLQTIMGSAKNKTLSVKTNVDILQEGEEPHSSKVIIAQKLAFRSLPCRRLSRIRTLF